MTTVLAHHERRAAHGLHRCEYCGERIAARELYADTRCADRGTAWTQRAHLACLDLCNAYGCVMGLDDDEWPDWSEVLAWDAEGRS